MSDTALVILARYPELGKGKTRLARSIGDEEALYLYSAFLTDLALRFAGGQEYDLHWTYTPAECDFPTFVATLAPTLTHSMQCFPQVGPDLGTRMHHAFKWTYERGFQRTILITSDSPQITLSAVASARKALDEVDMVLGPALDGGYYLIAMRKPYDLYTGIPMSTDAVGQKTIELATSQGLTVRLLEPLFDVDELPDLARLADLLQTDSALAPTTAAYLASKRNVLF